MQVYLLQGLPEPQMGSSTRPLAGEVREFVGIQDARVCISLFPFLPLSLVEGGAPA